MKHITLLLLALMLVSCTSVPTAPQSRSATPEEYERSIASTPASIITYDDNYDVVFYANGIQLLLAEDSGARNSIQVDWLHNVDRNSSADKNNGAAKISNISPSCFALVQSAWASAGCPS